MHGHLYCTYSTCIFPFLTSNVLALWRCCSRSLRLCLNSLMLKFHTDWELRPLSRYYGVTESCSLELYPVAKQLLASQKMNDLFMTMEKCIIYTTCSASCLQDLKTLSDKIPSRQPGNILVSAGVRVLKVPKRRVVELMPKGYIEEFQKNFFSRHR